MFLPANCDFLIAMSYQVMHDSVRLCSDRGQVLATYPAEKLAFSACCPDDRRFFGLVTMQATDDLDDCHFSNGQDEEGGLRTSCHVFIVDPELCHHQVWIKRKRRDKMRCYKSQWKGDKAVPFISTLNPLLLRPGFYFLFTLLHSLHSLRWKNWSQKIICSSDRARRRKRNPPNNNIKY